LIASQTQSETESLRDKITMHDTYMWCNLTNPVSSSMFLLKLWFGLWLV